MASTPTKSDFPKFLDGDVLILISTTQYYKLHSQVLSAHSSFFANEIATKPGPRLNAQARREHAATYRFEFQPSNKEGDFGQLVRVNVNESGRTTSRSTMLLPELDNGKIANSRNQAWDWLFGIFYNRQPAFDDSSLATVLGCVMGLIDCAESIGSIDHVRDVVDLALMRQDTVLWRSIMGAPIVWIELGRRVRSPAIFSEAAIHLIGQWGTIDEKEKDVLGADLRAIIKRKVDELDLAKEAIELRLLGHYPEFMHRTAADKPGRPSYSNDIYMWMCVSFFRQWVAQSISDDRTRRAPDGGLNFYAALAEGGQAYLSHLDFQEFHRYFPMSIKACHVLETNMGVLKEDIKYFVADLMTERTHLKRNDHDICWLTCAKIDKEDLPWNNPQPKKNDNLQDLYDAMDQDNALLEEAKSRGNLAGRTTPRPNKRARVAEEDSADDEYVEGASGEAAHGLFVPESHGGPMEED